MQWVVAQTAGPRPLAGAQQPVAQSEFFSQTAAQRGPPGRSMQKLAPLSNPQQSWFDWHAASSGAQSVDVSSVSSEAQPGEAANSAQTPMLRVAERRTGFMARRVRSSRRLRRRC